MIDELKEIKHTLIVHMGDLQKKFNVSRMGVFGSYVRGEQNNESDLDLLVEFTKPISLLKFIEMENYLRKILGVKMDLVMKESLKSRIGRHILDEVITV